MDALAASFGKVVLALSALLLGCILSAADAWGEDPSNVAIVDAAWGFISRNYYDQSFNGQDWEAMRGRYLARAQRGEAASRLTREMVASLRDRWSRVLDASTFEQLMAYDPLGVGLVLTRDENREVIVSSPPFANSAAAKAGIRQGDFVTAINGGGLGSESLFTIMDRVAQGDAPEVDMAFRRGPASAPTAAWERRLTRARAVTEKSRVDVRVVPAQGPGQHRVAYLRLRNFGAQSAAEMKAALQQARNEGADRLVLDLRGNSGGSFQAAVEISSLFLEPNALATRVQTPKGGERAVRVNADAQDAPVSRDPMVLLVDERSASASEVLSVALRGNCRAALLGDRTYGKGAVQGVFGLPNREALALTVAQYSGPGGTRIEGGLQPDLPGLASGPIARAAATLGVPVDLSPDAYATVDFAASDNALRACQPAESW